MAAVSLIVPIYNVEKYLEKCLQSIEKQIFDDYEVILVDDGSIIAGKLQSCLYGRILQNLN